MTPNHWLLLPVLVPMIAAITMMLGPSSRASHRLVSGLSLLSLVGVALRLVWLADAGQVIPYQMGDWPAPFGISLMLDRLSAMMVALTATLGTCAWLYACGGSDGQNERFHPLFQLLLMGVNGAFLTGDLFNLFVFFEILLIASYGLLMHGGGKRRLTASLHYVLLNLTGSALFLIAIAVVYGVTGTLNMAHIAQRAAQVSAADAPLLATGALLLMVVFGLKAAMFPMSFWLPRTYAWASPAVAALFGIMTKVGVYAIIRTFTLMFGADAGLVADIAKPWLLPIGLITMTLGTLGAVAATRLGLWAGALVVSSVGLLLSAVAMFSAASLGAALYYMIHSTLLGALTFLLVDLIRRHRTGYSDKIEGGVALTHRRFLGVTFLLTGMAVVGLPPLSGFLGKAMILQAIAPQGAAAWLWGLIVVMGLFTLIAVSRVGTRLFWDVPASAEADTPDADAPQLELPVMLLLGALLTISLAAGPLLAYTQRASAQLMNTKATIARVLPDGATGASATEVP